MTYIAFFEIAGDNISACDFSQAFAERYHFTINFPGTRDEKERK